VLLVSVCRKDKTAFYVESVTCAPGAVIVKHCSDTLDGAAEWFERIIMNAPASLDQFTGGGKAGVNVPVSGQAEVNEFRGHDVLSGDR
jgi:hypothetical protein